MTRNQVKKDKMRYFVGCYAYCMTFHSFHSLQTHQGDKHMKLMGRPLRLMLKERAIVQEDEEVV
ncbi:hypothetical protein Pyn_25207 [Prunus yedoensis var. nudiflora]|uniref:Uncharacterized protein n=1 Tax=Prunus yedoensis var. nudiflora TaxID=2094558 RepID=A0A314UWD0_PRUYE|nr:hypothetical protein Pyn_25207 [Prunus yedoensis var. nudiflora]